MSEKQSNGGRRNLLKTIAVGSGAVVAGKSMPANWTKPVVDAVLLPLHAATSPIAASGYYSSAESCFQVSDTGRVIMQIRHAGRSYIGVARSLPFSDAIMVWLNDGNYKISASGNVINGRMVGTYAGTTDLTAGVAGSFDAPKVAVACQLDSTNPPGPITLDSIEIACSACTAFPPVNIGIGTANSVLLQAYGNFSDGTRTQITHQVIWQTTDRSIATMPISQVSSRVTGVAPGTTTATAELFGVVGTVVVNVAT